MSTTLTSLAMAVLDLLHERDLHPYEMRQLMLHRHTDVVIKLKAGSLYHTVERLHRAELIEPVETSRDGRRPERTVYTLTADGRDAFAARLREMLAVPAEEYPAFPAALSFANTLPLPDALEQLTARQGRLEAIVAADQASHDRLTKMDLPRSYWIEFAYLRVMHQAELDWTTALLEDLETGRLAWPRPGNTKLTAVPDASPRESA